MHRLFPLSCVLTACAVGPAEVGPDVAEAESELQSDDFSVGSFTATLSQGGDEADFYYPIIAHHDHRAHKDPFPVVSFMQGGLCDKSYYSGYATKLAAKGFIVVIPNHLQSLPSFPGPVLLASPNAVDDVLADVKVRDADPSSPLYKIADTSKLAVGGHSYGGAIALWQVISGSCPAALCTIPYGSPPPELKAAILFGTHAVDSATNTAYPLDTAGVSVALLQGQNDGRAFPYKAALTYQELEPPRALIEFAGINHFGITDIQVLPGAIPDPVAQTMSQEESLNRLARWSARYLRSELLGRRGAARWIYDSGGSANGEVVVTSER